MIAWVIRNFGADEPPLRRLRIVASAARSGQTKYQVLCRDVALQVGEMLDIKPTIRQALAECHERWDGEGGPKRLKGEEIRLRRVSSTWRTKQICSTDWEASTPRSRCCDVDGEGLRARLADHLPTGAAAAVKA